MIALTPREEEVAALYRLRLPEKTIAARLHLSPRTVETHTRAIRDKTNTRSREEYIAATLTPAERAVLARLGVHEHDLKEKK